MFELLFSDLNIDDYFIPYQVAYGKPKTFGTPTPIDINRQQVLHNNWALIECERFDIGKLTVYQFFTLLSKYLPIIPNK